MRLRRSRLSGAIVSLAALFMLWSSVPRAVSAQTETGQIKVKVTDPQGAVVAGASISVKSTTTGSERTSATNEEGVATITALQPGVYDLTVTGNGFAPYKQQANVTVGAKLNVEVAISVTAKSEKH